MDHATLTPRQAEVFWYLEHGLDGLRTAERLKISKHSVRTHRARAYRRSGTSNEGEAMLWVREHRRCCLLRPLYSSETLGDWVRSLMGPSAPPRPPVSK